MKKTTAAWVRKAEADFQAAVKLGQGNSLFHDQVCFHCQQSSEKYLKALMEELGVFIPRTHDLGVLLNLQQGYHPSLRSLRRGLHFLSSFAVEIRYPDEDATKRQAQAALRWAERVRTAARALLGIPERR